MIRAFFKLFKILASAKHTLAVSFLNCFLVVHFLTLSFRCYFCVFTITIFNVINCLRMVE